MSIIPIPPLRVNGEGGIFSIIGKFIHKHYNIYKYNTRGKRRSAHHPKGGVAYVEIAGSSFRPSGRDKVGDYHHTQKITALSEAVRLFP